MKAELKLHDHDVLPGQKIIEVWYRGVMIATIAGADGPGVRVISKFIAGDTVSRPLPSGHPVMARAKEIGAHTVMLDIEGLK